MMRCGLIAFALLITGGPAAAQQQDSFEWKINDASAPPSSAQASEGGFGVLMLVTSDYDGFWKEWEGPTPPQIVTTEKVTRDEPVHAIILFSGCRPGKDGNCNVTMDVGVTGPSGAPYGDTFSGKVWSGPPAPQYSLQASEGGLGFILEPEDQLGSYVLKATITDHVAGITLPVQQVVKAVEHK